MTERVVKILSLGVLWIIAVIGFATMHMSVIPSVILASQIVLIAGFLIKRMNSNFVKIIKNTPGNFCYKYQQYPFDSWNYFYIEAENHDEADLKAQEWFSELVKNKFIVMTEFYRVDS